MFSISKTHTILGLMLFSLPIFSIGQAIHAGQSSGTNIIYRDIDDLSINSPYWNSSDFDYIDVDENDIEDIYLNTAFVYYSNPELLYAFAKTTSLGQIEFSTYNDHPDWIRKHNAGDTIDQSLFWNSGQKVFYSVNNSGGASGNFLEEGFLTFRDCGNDTVYGWIRVNNFVSFSGAYLTVYDYAFTKNISGLYSNIDNDDDFPIHRTEEKLILNLSDKFAFDDNKFAFDDNWTFTCYDIQGKIILRANPIPGENYFNISNFKKELLYGSFKQWTRLHYYSQNVLLKLHC